jgi:phosphatidate cytidylyltransferase
MTLTRILTAAILIPAVVAAVLWAPASVVVVFATAVLLITLLEFFSIASHAGFHGFRTWTGFCALAIFFMQWLVSAEQRYAIAGQLLLTHSPDAAASFSIEIALMLFALGCMAIILFGRQPVVDSLGALSISAAAMIFLVLPFSAVVRLEGAGHEGRKMLLFALVLVWVGDTFAYCVGRSIGRFPMATHLSPKKTWEGAFANLAGSILVAIVAQHWLALPTGHLIAMAVAANIAGQGGDLLESGYKRSAGVKDSGTILPGHGGMLDRIDALIFAAPIVWYYFNWLSNSGR